MPRLDHTGPEGRGTLTGRGLGNCRSKSRDRNAQERSENDFGRGGALCRGRRMGRKGGFGLRNGR